MTFDIVGTIETVHREVDDRDHEGRAAHAVIASRRYDAGIDDLWDALTNAERIPKWFLPIKGDLRQGGRFQLEGNASGEIVECEPPRHLALTWEHEGDVSWVTVDVEEADGGSRLRLQHVALATGDQWDEFGPGAVGVGWDMAIVALDVYLSTDGAVDPESLLTSRDGKAFIRESSDGWRQASVAAGVDEEAAEGAAKRTMANYTLVHESRAMKAG